MNYYNEFDPKAAAWLQELINQKLIPAGVVDTRSITEITPDDLRPYTQCHFFAGIGGWSYALQLAGWPADRPVWTGSCPCQPFSTAGKQLGDKDERHLWPVFFDLIRQCRPECVFGEQVANAIGKGWLDGVSADLESENYACGAVVLGAHSVGAPHIRQRLYWVADSAEPGVEELVRDRKGLDTPAQTTKAPTPLDARTTHTDWMEVRSGVGQPGLLSSYDGVSAGLVRLRGYGNAIVPQVAAEFIKAWFDVTDSPKHGSTSR